MKLVKFVQIWWSCLFLDVKYASHDIFSLQFVFTINLRTAISQVVKRSVHNIRLVAFYLMHRDEKAGILNYHFKPPRNSWGTVVVTPSNKLDPLFAKRKVSSMNTDTTVVYYFYRSICIHWFRSIIGWILKLPKYLICESMNMLSQTCLKLKLCNSIS